MSFLDTQDHFGDVKLCGRLAQNILPNEEPEEVTTWHVFYDKIQALEILETGNEWHNPAVESVLTFFQWELSREWDRPFRTLRGDKEVSLSA